MQIPNNRTINLLIFLLCATAIGIALYMEHVMLLSPCGLCISQRVFVIFCGLVCLASAIHNPSPAGEKTYIFTAAAMTIIGSYFSIRQIWLQHLPEDQVPACGPGLSYIFENFPFIETLNFLLVGDGNCAEVTYRFLGLLSIAEMVQVFFAVLFAILMFMAFRKPTRN